MSSPLTRQNTTVALARGFSCRCPQCGEGHLFRAFLKTHNRCSRCGQAFHHHRADDLPAYLVISVVGHVVVGLALFAERRYGLSYAAHLALWLPLTLGLSLGLLQPVKGLVVTLQWQLGMHGFGRTPVDASPYRVAG